MSSINTILGHDIDEDVVALIFEVDKLFPNREVMIHDIELFNEETKRDEKSLYGGAVGWLGLRDYIGIWVKKNVDSYIFNALLRHELIHFIQQYENYKMSITFNGLVVYDYEREESLFAARRLVQ